MSPAQAILKGYNKDSVFSQQQAFKKRNGLKDDGSAKYGLGGDIKGIWNFIRSYRTPVDNIAALITAYQKLNPNSNYNKQKVSLKVVLLEVLVQVVLGLMIINLIKDLIILMTLTMML